MIFVSGCAAPKPITVYETKEVVRDRYVPIDPSLTAPVDIITLSEDFDLYALGAAYKAQRVRAEQCNGQLAEIAKLGNSMKREDQFHE